MFKKALCIMLILTVSITFGCFGKKAEEKKDVKDVKARVSEFADPIKGADNKARDEAKEKLGALAKLKNPEDLQLFQELAKDGSKDVRAALMSALAGAPDGKGYWEIFEKFIDSKDKDDYRNACWYTDGFGRNDVTKSKVEAAWEKAFKSNTEEEAKRNALTGLRRVGTPAAIMKLQAFSIDDPEASPGIIATGIDELVWIRKLNKSRLEEFMPKENPKTKKPNHPYVRAMAIYRYGSLKTKDKAIAKELVKYLDDMSEAKYKGDTAWGGGFVAGSAIRALEACCGYDAVKSANKNIFNEKDVKALAKEWKTYVGKMK